MKVIDLESSKRTVFTIKNYNNELGLSQQFFLNPSPSFFEVKGPLGKGLELNEESHGLHVVFAGGTGLLCFIDLVAHVALKNLGLLDKIPGAQKLPDDFKLILYASFRNRMDSVCLELCEALRDLTNHMGVGNFELKVRLSNEKATGPRWDDKFITEQMKSFGSDLKKVWVCGPPVMNETFDRLYEKARYGKLPADQAFPLSADQYDVM
mmetsp:Transcript_72594/g.100651  ORF Transcript_72594/g.100651 Transcript_72594/m.100651 type:complete len:209 (+) Transcript_72594:1897-2523(+)|eukprot:CAMPEP_0176370410 /NCGR_PEP_ID=MMETSP0126-20121128/23971_1 /TAXON_ID=141414 ORGANISM="Strombidinopsis acuminatum, Strain SPMC142" /NCGR_SAMPLE_ID=MMETSP0126 /ASSEMBLY_ACC=CAM_ASM_000229 /LENGTH=208 /DNA_ID=CAMNT_0017729441 /DNA_START=2014 /DNA_END=2640 /DNA_ORIENTATION=+